MAIIDKPTDYFNTKLYTGTGSELAITGVGFQPDWTWIKGRNVAYDHNLFDVVRGVTKTIKSNKDDAESTQAQMLKSFNSDGFTIGTDGAVNENDTRTYVAWNWKAGGSGSANTDGSINTSSTSVNTTAGFSISKYTGNATNGATVGHGLGAVPDMIIGKDLGDTSSWGVWHKDLTNAGYRLALSSTAAQSDDSALFGGSSRTAPTSSVFSLGSGGGLNGNGSANIVYCFSGVQGFSKFGKYTGNGNANGTFIYTGFAPAFVIVKAISISGENWQLNDNKRKTFNVNSTSLFPNLNNTESTDGMYIDMLSNGFKARETGNGTNGSGVSYIYMAFAENPFVASNFNAATAR